MRKRFNKLLKKIIIFLQLFLIVFFSCANSIDCQAASLVDKDSKWYKSVYSTPTATPVPDGDTASETNAADEFKFGEEDGESNFVIDMFAKLISIFPYLIDIVFKQLGMLDENGNGYVGADQIVKGRIGKGVDSLNMFGFELVDGNVYGFIGAKIYTIVRTIILALFAYMLFLELTKLAFKSTNAQSYAEFKDFLSTLCVNFLLVFFMPTILEFVLFLRDYLVKMCYALLFDGNTRSLYTLFKESYKTNGDLGSVIMWTAVSGSTFVFAFIYFSMAACMIVTFAIFPAVCLVSVKNKNLMREWVGNMASNVVTPLIDIFLVCIPILIGRFPYNKTVNEALIILVQVVFTWMIIPMRGYIRKSLGFGSSVVGESMGLGAFAQMRRLARGVGHNAKGMVDRYKEAKEKSDSDKEKADMYQDLANAETISDPNAGQYSGIDTNSKSMDGLGGAESPHIKSSEEKDGTLSLKKEDEENGNISAMNINDGNDGMEKNDGSEQVANEEMMKADTITGETGEHAGESIKEDNNVGEDVAGISNMENTEQNLSENVDTNSVDTAFETIGNTENNSPTPQEFSASGNIRTPGNNRIINLENMDRLNKDVAALQKNKNDIREANAGLKSDKIANAQKLTNQKLNLEERNRALLAGAVTSKYGEGPKNTNKEIEENNEAIQAIDKQLKNDSAAYDLAMSQNEQMMSGIDSEVARKQEEIKEAKDTEKVMSNGKPVGSASEFNAQQRRNQIIASHANTKNFEEPEMFNALSAQQKADFYRQRSKETMQQARKDVAKDVAARVGKTAGGITGAAFLAYGGVDASIAGAIIGEDLGESVGRSVGRSVGELAYEPPKAEPLPGKQTAHVQMSNIQQRVPKRMATEYVDNAGGIQKSSWAGQTEHVQVPNIQRVPNRMTTEHVNNADSVLKSSQAGQVAHVQVSNMQQRVPNRMAAGHVNNADSVLKSSWAGQTGSDAIQSPQSWRELNAGERRKFVQVEMKNINNASTANTTKDVIMNAVDRMDRMSDTTNSKDFARAIADSIKEFDAQDILEDKQVQDVLSGIAQKYGCEGDFTADIKISLEESK